METFYGEETFRAAFVNRSNPNVSFGLRFSEACSIHVESTLNASRVYLIVSRSLSANTDAVERLRSTLGERMVGFRVGMKPQTHWSEIIEILDDARPLDPDCILTVGAGSLTDAAKIISWALANNVQTEKDLAALAASSPKKRDDPKPPNAAVICVPTSLSGGEYSTFAGATNDETNVKELFVPPGQNPAIVILDPEVTVTTPNQIWLSTGVRSIDHCVETLCSLMGNPEADAVAERAVEMLIPALLKCKNDPGDLTARFECQMGALEAMKAAGHKVPMGGSHAIGHQLGPLGVGHGETSCICLPAVCKFNAAKGANMEQQEKLAKTLSRIAEVQKLMDGREGDLGDILDVVIRALGMPRSLKEVGIGREMLGLLAENTVKDKWAKTNPVPLTHKGLVLEILEMIGE